MWLKEKTSHLKENLCSPSNNTKLEQNGFKLWFYMTCFWLCWGLTTRQPLRVILCHLPEKGRTEIEEIVEAMKERDKEKQEWKWRNRRNNKNIGETDGCSPNMQ